MSDTISIIKKISIRARFAIALTCVKKELRQEGLLEDEFARIIIDKYAQFTSCRKFDVWLDEVDHYVPGAQGLDCHLSFINNRFESADDIIKSLTEINNKYLSSCGTTSHSTWYQGIQLPICRKSVYEDLLVFYNLIEERLAKMLNQTYEIAIADMYCSTGKYSESSLRPLLKVIEMSDYAFDFKEIMGVYPFSEDGGWGHSFEFKTFMK
jgi:hypothetical protein